MLSNVGAVHGDQAGLARADRPGPTRRGSVGGRELVPTAPEVRLRQGDNNGVRPRSLSQTRLRPATAELRPPLFANKAAIETFSQRPEQHASPAPKLAEGGQLLRDIPQALGEVSKFSVTRGKAAKRLDEFVKHTRTDFVNPGHVSRQDQLKHLDGKLQSAERHLTKYIATSKRFAKLPDQLPGGASEPMKKAHAVRESLRQLHTDIQVTRQSIDTLSKAPTQSEASFVGLDSALTLARYGFPPAPKLENDILIFSAAKETSREVLGSGAVNTVSKVQYAGQDKPMVYKPLATGPGYVPGSGVKIGIDPNNPRYGQRNLATSVMAEALGLDIVAKTHLASNGDELGIVMEFAPGESPNDIDPRPLPISSADLTEVRNRQATLANLLPTLSEADRADQLKGFMQDSLGKGLSVNPETGEWEKHASIADRFDVAGDPSLMHQLCDLEVLDKGCAQVDRHPGNYMVDPYRGPRPDGSLGTKVKAIDNDLSFGKDARNPGRAVGHATGWPVMMSTNMRDALIGLEKSWDQPGGTRERLSVLLTPDELSATHSRYFGNADGKPPPPFIGLIQHAKDLTAQGRVIAADGWDKPTRLPDGSLGPKPIEIARAAGPLNSYIAKLDDQAQQTALAKA